MSESLFDEAASQKQVERTPLKLRDVRVRMRVEKAFQVICWITAILAVAVLVWLLMSIAVQGIPSLSYQLLVNAPEPDPEMTGMRPAIFGTIWVCTLCGLLTLPIGIATAVLLEEFRPKGSLGQWVYSLIQTNISNLAGVPSVVYGIVGLTAFVTMFGAFSISESPPFEIGARHYKQYFSEGDRGLFIPVEDPSEELGEPVDGMTVFMFSRDESGQTIVDYDQLIATELNVIDEDDPFPEDESVLERSIFPDSTAGALKDESWYYFRLPFGRGVLTGALTLMLVILPVVIIASQEALRAVPSSMRDGARGLGATPWQVVRTVTLPAAVPGIMTGSILAMSRAIGETAPIFIIAGIVFIRQTPQHLMDDFTVMPMQIYNWTSRPQKEFHDIAAAGIIVLLITLLSFNAVAVFIRQKVQKPLS
ncbi:MAG: PstA family ABC transporter permease [Planctomycetota bacterium]